MNSKAISIVIAALLIVTTQFCRASANARVNYTQKNSALQIHLPREITVADDIITLGNVSIVRGNESVVDKASALTLGQISTPEQELVISKTMLLSRLACNGIPAAQVTLTGAEKVRVKRQQQIIKASQFVDAALSFLKKNLPANVVCLTDPIRMPKDLYIANASRDIRLLPHLVANGAKGQAKVQIDAFADDQKIAAQEITFRLKYNCHKFVTLVELGAGAVISPENVKIEQVLSDYPEPADWKPPYGLITRRRLPAKTVIRPAILAPVEPEIIVKRNQSVLIRIEKPGILVTAIGKTLQDGKAGEFIRIRNADSQRIILAKVKQDGTVEPVF
ncbi:MAG: flagellar basal body P-ring formation chaperone FlgA [Planctomycetota bacterium]|jgi:flagella basal body P-ring formation protein FlgA